MVTAKADLRAIHDFIAPASRHYAQKVAQDIAAKTAILDEFPHVGRVVPELSNQTIREISVYSYRILYEIQDQTVFVLAIVHKRRDLPQAGALIV